MKSSEKFMRSAPAREARPGWSDRRCCRSPPARRSAGGSGRRSTTCSPALQAFTISRRPPSRRPVVTKTWRHDEPGPAAGWGRRPVAGAGGSSGRGGGVRLRLLDDEDVVAVEAGDHRGLRQGDDVLLRRQIDAHADELARGGARRRRCRSAPARRRGASAGSIFGSMPMTCAGEGHLVGGRRNAPADRC